MHFVGGSLELCYMKCILIISLFIFSYMDLNAQTPIEDLIIRYKDSAGVQCFVAENEDMSQVYKAFAASPLSSIAYDVMSFYILKMSTASFDIIERFMRNVDDVLRTNYTDFSMDFPLGGESRVYVTFLNKNIISEMIIYNPALLILNDIQGEFNVKSLKQK